MFLPLFTPFSSSINTAERSGSALAELLLDPGLDPDTHYWTKRKQPWFPIPDGARSLHR